MNPNASLFFWTGLFMYIGRAIDTSIHKHHTVQIAISFDEPFEIILPGRTLKHKAVIIDSDQPHECRTFNNQFLLLNIDPETRIGIALKKGYLANQKISELPAAEASEFTSKLSGILAAQSDNDEIHAITHQFIYALADLDEPISMDERILEVINILKHQFDEQVKVTELAARVFISPSRLIHLFTEQVGIPIRKYILWTKILAALNKIIETGNLSQAALYSGFSDAPHFNRTFKKMFGLNPSTLLKNSQIVQASRK